MTSGLLKEATAVVHRQRTARKKPSSTSAPMKRMTPASGLPSAGVEAEAACEHRTPAAVAASRRLVRQQAAGEPRNDDAWLVAGHEVVQWVNKLEVMEDKIKKRETNLKRVLGHLEAAKRYMTDFTNPVEWHEQMIAEIPLPVRQGRALSDRQVAVNVQAQTLTQRLMAVTAQAVQAEAVMRQLEVERSTIFARIEDHCLEKLESILEEYSDCLTFAPTRWGLMRELVRKDGVTLVLLRSIIGWKGQDSDWTSTSL